jgi:hypothetical protein
MDELLYFNGIDGATGDYLLPSLTAGQVSDVAQGMPLDPNETRELKGWRQYLTEAHFGVSAGIDPKDVAQTGWGAIFPAKTDPTIREALGELLDWRRAQAAKTQEYYYKEYTGPDGYRLGESKQDFLSRHGAGPGPADPENVPYYLLIVGDPETIPYRFQSLLDVQYAVGRIHFDTLDEYARYAHSVVEAEKQQLNLPRKAAFFGVKNSDDPATNLSADELVAPLAERLSTNQPNWAVQAILQEQATKQRLGSLLGGDETPALLFTGSHGMGFPKDHSLQMSSQGALLCQDWPGPREWRQAIPPDFYFSAADLGADAKLFGLLAFCFACYGAGTPRLDEFARQAFKDTRAEIAPKAFLSALPRRMLTHPNGGALAVVGHIDRAWGYSFHWGKAGKQLQTFESALKSLMDGYPLGAAFEYFNQRYAEIASDLSSELEEIEFGKKYDKYDLAGMWTANNDARDYLILGDPAVRLMVGGSQAPALEGRPVVVSAPTVLPASTAVKSLAPQAPTVTELDSQAQELAEQLEALLDRAQAGGESLQASTVDRLQKAISNLSVLIK